MILEIKRAFSFVVLFIMTANANAQRFNVKIRFSEPLAVFDFVENLSNKSPENQFKKLFQSSVFNNEQYNSVITEFDKLIIENTYDYSEYPYAQKIGGSTKSLLKKQLLNSKSLKEFEINSVGIVPNIYLFQLSAILNKFTIVYQALVYKPNKSNFERQLRTIKDLVVSKNISSFLKKGITFYNSSWNNSIPFEIIFYPLPDSKGFTATVFYNNAVSAIPSGLKDYNLLVAVIVHEIFHVFYDEQSPAVKNEIHAWVASNPSENKQYAYLLLNEALATAMGNGYVYEQLTGKENKADWYRRKYINLMAKKIYPLLKEYILKNRAIDQGFVDTYISLFDVHFSNWLLEADYIMTDRFILTDTPADFDTVDELFPFRSMSQYENGISAVTVGKMLKAPVTKCVFISTAHKQKIEVLKLHISELENWHPNDEINFIYRIKLSDKTFLIIINSVNETIKNQLLKYRTPN